MTRRPTHRTSAPLGATLLVALVGLTSAACSSSAPASSPAATPAPSASPTVTAAPTPTPSPTPTVAPTATPAPTTTQEAPSAPAGPSVHIDLPKGWQQVQMTVEALTAQMKVVEKTNPQMGVMLKQMLDSGSFKGFLFYALGFEGIKNVGNLNVTVIESGGASLDAVQPVIEGEFKQLGAIGITFRHTSVKGVDSLVVDYKVTVGTQVMVGRGYFIPSGSVLYDVTTTCYGKSTAACLADGDAMAKGMTVTP